MSVPLSVPFNSFQIYGSERQGFWSELFAEFVLSGTFILGESVRSFETAFSSYCGTASGLGVASGTDALELALRAVDCGPGTEVIVTGNAGGYSTIASLLVGATPVIVDVLQTNGLIDTSLVLEAVSSRTKAVVVTHLYGQMVEIPALRKVLDPRISIIEDAAQAHGARSSVGCAGAMGDLSCFSFYPTKNLGALGDGGFITGIQPALITRARQLAQYGWSSRYLVERPFGRNSRLDELQAKILLSELNYLEERNFARIRNASYISSRVPAEHRVTPILTTTQDERPYVGHLCVLRASKRNEAISRLAAMGVTAAVHYPIPDHMQVGFRDYVKQATSLDQTTRLCSQVVSIPCGPDLTPKQLDHVASCVQEVWSTQ